MKYLCIQKNEIWNWFKVSNNNQYGYEIFFIDAKIIIIINCIVEINRK